MCNCLEKIETEVKEKIRQIVKDKGQDMVGFVDNGEDGFQCKGLFISGGGWQFVLPMVYKYILRKKDGTPEKRVSKYKTNMLPAYCPMCGKKITRK